MAETASGAWNQSCGTSMECFRSHPRAAERAKREHQPKRVARPMRRNAVHGISRSRGVVVTTRRDDPQRPAPDLVKREFTADGPNQLWAADMPYALGRAGLIYLAVVLDV